MTTHPKMRKLLVFITEEHNNVVPFIHRSIASKNLPFNDIPIVHLDSHPDLLIPPNLRADSVFKTAELYEFTSIENWLLPQVFAKHINPVMWIKPPWAHQIKTSSQRFLIGKCKQSGLVRVSSKENYFLTDGLYRQPKDLVDTSNLHLLVLEMRPDRWSELDSSFDSKDLKTTSTKDAQFSDYYQWKNLVHDELQDRPYILDVDLDFFSTQNPFKDMLRPEAEEALKRLYYTPINVSQCSEQELEAFISLREKHLNDLENLWLKAEEHLSVKKEKDGLSSETVTLSNPIGMEDKALQYFTQEQQQDICLLMKELLEGPGEITFTQIHDFGCTLDDTELPHHVSTEPQVEALCAAFTTVLEALPKPAIVTIARSSIDEYCPASCVDQYETKVLQILGKLYGDLNVTKDYS